LAKHGGKAVKELKRSLLLFNVTLLVGAVAAFLVNQIPQVKGALAMLGVPAPRFILVIAYLASWPVQLALWALRLKKRIKEGLG